MGRALHHTFDTRASRYHGSVEDDRYSLVQDTFCDFADFRVRQRYQTVTVRLDH